MAQLKVSDGRVVHYSLSGGKPRAPALVFHHGQPGAALLWDGMVREADKLGWSVVMISRPGYATSERKVGRVVADAASDVGEVLDHLGVGRFVAIGWSGGGPHALACGALMAPRCRAVATIAGVAPYHGVDDLDWTAGMGPENVAEFEALFAGDQALEEKVKEACGQLEYIQADQLIDALGGLLSEPDKAVLTGAFAEYVAKWMRLSASSGHYGYWDDDQAFVNDWGFELGEIAVPTTIWIAGRDLMVPPAHGRWLAEHVPGAQRLELPEEGHVSIFVRHIDDMVRRLAEDAGL